MALGKWYANEADRIATVVHNVLHIFCYLWVAGETANVPDIWPPCDKHVSRCYVCVVDGKTSII